MENGTSRKFPFLNRRKFIVKGSVVAGALSLISGAGVTAAIRSGNNAHAEGSDPSATPTDSSTGFVLPPLGYNYNALEPYIDELTMHLHHDKHHATYVTNLNTALKDSPFLSSPIEEVLRRLNEIPEDIRTTVRNNGGGHYNHTLFWESMKPGGCKTPVGDLANAINSTFNSFDAFKTAFNEAGTKRFGSGWAWLALDKSGKLLITSTANQDTPLLEDQIALLGNDVWEHAYYLSYQNRRADYLTAWWNVVNWNVVAQRYADALQSL